MLVFSLHANHNVHQEKQDRNVLSSLIWNYSLHFAHLWKHTFNLFNCTDISPFPQELRVMHFFSCWSFPTPNKPNPIQPLQVHKCQGGACCILRQGGSCRGISFPSAGGAFFPMSLFGAEPRRIGPGYVLVSLITPPLAPWPPPNPGKLTASATVYVPSPIFSFSSTERN